MTLKHVQKGIKCVKIISIKMNKKLFVPDIGDFESVEVIEILVKKGDKISLNDPVITIESDKSSVEVPSIFNGIIDSVNVKIGDKVSKGDLILSVHIEGKNDSEKTKKKKVDGRENMKPKKA